MKPRNRTVGDCLFRALLWLAGAAFLAGNFAGCNPGPKVYHVSGTVTYEGKPVPRGTVKFVPDTTKGNSGPAAVADIVDGKFDTATKGTGTVGGPHKIVITGFDGNAKPESELPLGKLMFSDYTTEADLPKENGKTVDFKVQKVRPE